MSLRERSLSPSWGERRKRPDHCLQNVLINPSLWHISIKKTKTKTIVLTERERFKNSICFDWHPASTRHSSDWFCCRFHWSSVPSQSCVTNHPALSVSRSRSVQPCSQQDLLALMSAQRCLSSHPSPDLQCLCLDCAGSHSCCWLSELLINVSLSVLPPRSISSLSESNHLICIKKNLTLGMLWRQRNLKQLPLFCNNVFMLTLLTN